MADVGVSSLLRRPIHMAQSSPAQEEPHATNGDHGDGERKVDEKVQCTIDLRHFEFGGRLCAALLFIALPLCLLCANVPLSTGDLSLFNLRYVRLSLLSPIVDWQAFAAVAAWLLANCAFYRYWYVDVFDNTVWSRYIANGGRLLYRCNGVYCLLMAVSLVPVAAALGVIGAVDAWLARHRLAMLVAATAVSFVLAVCFYRRSFDGVHALSLTLDGCTGSPVYDMFVGRELNPRVHKMIDVKLVLYRQALVASALQVAVIVVAAHTRHPVLNWPMIVLAAAQLLYIFDALWYEKQMLNTFAMLHDGVGFMQLFGALCIVPFLFTVPMCYLRTVATPSMPSILCTVPHMIIFGVGYYMTRSANSVKSLLRTDCKHASLKDKRMVATYEPLVSLYADGLWRRVRHPNYAGELVMAFAWTTLCGFKHVLPYSYVLYLLVHLAHRVGRMERRLALRYNNAWLDYCELVPYKIAPRIW